MRLARGFNRGTADEFLWWENRLNGFWAQIVYDNSTQRWRKKKGGRITFATGLNTALIGSLIRIPGFHFRRSIPYYNKSLQSKNVSIHLEPHWDYASAGAGLVVRF